MLDQLAAPPLALPRENIVRAMVPGLEYEVRDEGDGAPGGSATPLLFGHLGVFDEWEEIDSLWEGNFMESLAPGSFAKTIRENRSRVKPTFNHGYDPDMGDKVLGPVRELREDDVGAYYEVPLFPSVPPLIVEGLREGVYGSSFRFRVTREDIVTDPGVSDHNPKGLPERTIREVQLHEFGPVTFPQYLGATAAVRSMTDEEVVRTLLRDPARLRHVIESLSPTDNPPPEQAPVSATPATDAGTPEPPRRFRTREEFLTWIRTS